MPVPHSPRAPASWRHPEPPGWCDRCGFKYLHRDLTWQSDWRGSELANLGLLVCRNCLDEPQPNGRRPIIIGPDSIGPRDPRPGFAAIQMPGSVPLPGDHEPHLSAVPEDVPDA